MTFRTHLWYYKHLQSFPKSFQPEYEDGSTFQLNFRNILSHVLKRVIEVSAILYGHLLFHDQFSDSLRWKNWLPSCYEYYVFVFGKQHARANNRTSLTDDKRSGWARTAITNDRRIKVRDIAQTCHILSKEWGMHKLSARWVLRLFTLDQKRIRLYISKALLQQLKRDDL